MILGSYLTKPTVDVINVVSVTASATVNQWDEQNEEEIQSALYWRQAIDVRTMELSVSSQRQAPKNMPLTASTTVCGASLPLQSAREPR